LPPRVTSPGSIWARWQPFEVRANKGDIAIRGQFGTKWLSYREEALLGRPLTVDEVGYVTQVVRRIAALVLLGPDLDANYRRVKADPYPWLR
jgi:hypothetical protein